MNVKRLDVGEVATERDEVLALTGTDEDGDEVLELNASTRPPTIDDYDDYDDYSEAVPADINYPSWTSTNSMVVSGPLGAYRFPGRRFENRDAARAWAIEKYGLIFEDIRMVGRWGFRVRKPGA